VPGNPSHLIRARWLAPIDHPVIAGGGLMFEAGFTEGVGPADVLAAEAARRHPRLDVIVHDYGNAVILPGLVNAHVHLELSHLQPPPRVTSFTGWISAIMSSPAPSTTDPVRAGATESLGFGVTAVGDISRDPVAAREALATTQLRGVSYGEVVGMAGRRHLLESRLAAALDTAHTALQPRTIHRGISPHAPYSVEVGGYLRCIAAARREQLPLTTHLAESPSEAEFLSDHTGPFRALWDTIGAWDDGVPRRAGGPIRLAERLGLLDYPQTLLAHVNYCDDDELDILARGRASVVYCPRTHAYFGHPPHRWREMRARGINVCVGTDSRASAPDLNLVEDLRLLHRVAPEVPVQTLWEMATVCGARGLGLTRASPLLKTLSTGCCVVFPTKTDEPLIEILETDVAPVSVWVNGKELPAPLC
jgi:cytosine/adenosine deaminase-related metal-dependent hydrolase